MSFCNINQFFIAFTKSNISCSKEVLESLPFKLAKISIGFFSIFSFATFLDFLLSVFFNSGVILFFDSPEFNPDEYLNQDYKSNVHKNGLPKNQKELKNNTEKYMLELQKNTQKVANFFQHPSVRYAS